MAFQKFEDGKYVFDGLINFKQIYVDYISNDVLKLAIKNSFVVYFYTTLVGLTLNLLFSYFIYKKYIGHKFFKMMLFLPSIISSIVLVIIYQNFIDKYIPVLIWDITKQEGVGLLTNPDTRFVTLLIYSIFISFGTNVLLFSSAMNQINPSLIEAFRLESSSSFLEFIYVIIPGIWPTIVTLMLTGLAGLFVNQMNLFSFYGVTVPDYNLYTMGYYLFRNTAIASTAEYPKLAAIGILITLFLAPITLLVRKLLLKYGPREE